MEKEVEQCRDSMVSLPASLILLVAYAGFINMAFGQKQTRTALELADGTKLFCQGKGKNWKEADLHCRGRGMVLPTVRDLHTGSRIVNHCGIKCTGHCAFWLGAVRHQGKNYRWGTGIVINNKDPLWLPHNPSYDGSCLEFHTYPGERWGLNDEACTTKTDRWVVCSKGPTVPTAALDFVDGRKFFCQGKLEMNRKEADAHCRSRGMVLPTVKDLHTANRIVNHCGIKCTGHCAFWLDAVRHQGKNYRWGTGIVINNKDPLWLPHNPSYDGSCLEFHTYPRERWGLNDEACTTKTDRWVVCSKGPTVPTAALDLVDGRKFF